MAPSKSVRCGAHEFYTQGGQSCDQPVETGCRTHWGPGASSLSARGPSQALRTHKDTCDQLLVIAQRCCLQLIEDDKMALVECGDAISPCNEEQFIRVQPGGSGSHQQGSIELLAG